MSAIYMHDKPQNLLKHAETTSSCLLAQERNVLFCRKDLACCSEGCYTVSEVSRLVREGALAARPPVAT